MAHANFAATIQSALEEAVWALAELAKRRSGCDRLIITGGVGLNCTLNGRLARSGMFREVYVPPVTFDTGVALGAALSLHRQMSGRGASGEPMPHAYYGIAASAHEIEAALGAVSANVRCLDDDELLPIVAGKIAEGQVVGWFQGRAEIGQRALGARSILCDPRQRRRLVKVNLVKGREVWRPLAPSILAEHYQEFFEGPAPAIADFMLAAMPVRAEARRRIPATVHVDGSARPQVVHRTTNSRYWRLIEEFRRVTGVPAVMNTSFNLAGEPIVHTPEDAVSSFMRSDLDALVIESYLVQKSEVPKAARLELPAMASHGAHHGGSEPAEAPPAGA
jgi:carbamoyltransferase